MSAAARTVERWKGYVRGVLAQIAQGRSGNPCDWLLAVAGLSYILAVALFRWRG